MSEGFAYLDILFFAMVAAFVALRLRSVLGRRTGQERRRGPGFGAAPNGSDNVVSLPDRGKATPTDDPGIADVADPALKTGLTEIRMADSRFDLASFLQGARAAFGMIVEAFANGDKAALKPLLAPPVYESFARAIDARTRKGQTLETQLVGIRAAEVADASLTGSTARVAVRFKSEQVNTVRDSQGAVVPEGSHDAEEVVDIWTFERDVRARDPNWTLVETRTPE
jgi:predicted lipid-binding transport protein (Tim44 family)